MRSLKRLDLHGSRLCSVSSDAFFIASLGTVEECCRRVPQAFFTVPRSHVLRGTACWAHHSRFYNARLRLRSMEHLERTLLEKIRNAPVFGGLINSFHLYTAPMRDICHHARSRVVSGICMHPLSNARSSSRYSHVLPFSC